MRGKTFSDLGIPVPLFEAPIDCAEGYAGEQRCTLCDRDGHCFRLGIGDDVLIECLQCKSTVALCAADCVGGECTACGANVPFPRIGDDEEVHCCFACLRAGRAAMTKDTELGMIRYEDAIVGVTHGVPSLDHPDFEMVPKGEADDDDDNWVGARLPSADMLELIRTPTYSTWQGESWLFCCAKPMIFVGTWSIEDFDKQAPGDPRALFRDPDNTGTDVYLFRCQVCSGHAAYGDRD